MTKFYDWQASGRNPGAPFNRTSPNLVQLRVELARLFGGTSLGGYYVRPIRAGQAWSSHAFGAAIDWRIDDDTTRARAIEWLVANENVLGIQAIHDYHGSRIWRVGRGWREQPASSSTGMGQAWAKYLHLETPPDRWADATPIAQRTGTPPTPTPPPTPALIVDAPSHLPFSLREGVDDPHRVRWLQTICNQRGWHDSDGHVLAVDGRFGRRTGEAVRTMQRALGVVADGIYGLKSATALHHRLRAAA